MVSGYDGCNRSVVDRLLLVKYWYLYGSVDRPRTTTVVLEDGTVIEESPFNLDNMKLSLEILKQLNDLRHQDGLNTLKVDTNLMAMSQVATAWAQHYNSSGYGDTGSGVTSSTVHNVSNDNDFGENAAWNSTNGVDGVTGAMAQWYTNEKAIYDSDAAKGFRDYLQKLYTGEITSSITTKGNWNNCVYVAGKNPAYTDIYHKTGHYLNIINPQYEYMGAGYALSTDYTVWNTYEQSFDFSATGKTYTVDAFVDAFNAYYDKVMSSTGTDLSKLESAMNEAQANYDYAVEQRDNERTQRQEALEKRKAAEKVMEENEDVYNSAIETIKPYQEAYDNANAAYQTALDEYNKADGKLSDLQKDVDDCEGDLSKANDAKNDAFKTYTAAAELAGQLYTKSEELKKKYEALVEQQKGDEETAAEIDRLRGFMEAAESAWKTAQEKTDDLHQIYIDKDQTYLNADNDAKTAASKLEQAKNDKSAAEETLAGAETDLNAAKKVMEEFGEYGEAANKVSDATAKLGEAQSDVKTAEENLEKAKGEYDEAVEVEKKAAADKDAVPAADDDDAWQALYDAGDTTYPSVMDAISKRIEAEKKLADAKSDLTEAESAKKVSDAEFEDAKSALETAKKNYEDAVKALEDYEQGGEPGEGGDEGGDGEDGGDQPGGDTGDGDEDGGDGNQPGGDEGDGDDSDQPGGDTGDGDDGNQPGGDEGDGGDQPGGDDGEDTENPGGDGDDEKPENPDGDGDEDGDDEGEKPGGDEGDKPGTDDGDDEKPSEGDEDKPSGGDEGDDTDTPDDGDGDETDDGDKPSGGENTDNPSGDGDEGNKPSGDTDNDGKPTDPVNPDGGDTTGDDNDDHLVDTGTGSEDNGGNGDNGGSTTTDADTATTSTDATGDESTDATDATAHDGMYQTGTDAMSAAIQFAVVGSVLTAGVVITRKMSKRQN